MIDLTGQRFGKLVAKEYAGKSRWQCLCDCGGMKEARADALKDGNVTSCGCKRTSFKNILGMTFGKLKVIEEVVGLKKSGSVCWKCLCECGASCIVTSRNLIGGGTASCGCLVKEVNHLIHSKHSMSGHPLYSVWSGMMKRCNSLTEDHYGGRGIRVCDRHHGGSQ